MTDTPSRPVRVRFAPSPTGDMHIGGGRTALFDWLMAHHYGGQFILRIEDTDEKRFKENSLQGIIDGLHWLGLQWDEGPDIGGPFSPYIQSQRLPTYLERANWLVEQGKAYRAYETAEELTIISTTRRAKGLAPGYDRRGRSVTAADHAKYEAEGKPYVIRFKVPDGHTTFVDLVRGPLTIDNDQLQDPVILKSDGNPTYHLAHVIDDKAMEISHIIRAEEWISSTYLHKMLWDAFGWEMPQVAHVPDILKMVGTGKMSKRDEGASISYFVDNGYLPEAVVNYLCNVGWNYGVMDDKGEEVQVFTIAEAAEVFDITRVSKSGTKFDLVKLQWLNGVYIRAMSPADLVAKLRPPLEKAGYHPDDALLMKIVPLVQERLKLLNDIVELAGFFFESELPSPTPEALIPKGLDAAQTKLILTRTESILSTSPEIDPAALEVSIRALAQELTLKAGPVISVLRNAVTGRTISPPLFESMAVIGQQACLKQITQAIAVL